MSKYKCGPEVYKALVDISEVIYAIVRLNNVYSKEISDKLNQALRSINDCIED